MKIKKFMPLLAAVTLVAACTGGGGDGSSAEEYTPAPIPPEGQRAYMYVANSNGDRAVYAYQIDRNNNPNFIKPTRTATDLNGQYLKLSTPYYILVNSNSTIAYLSDAPLHVSAIPVGNVYACDISSNGLLVNCEDMQISSKSNQFDRPLSLSLSGNNLYIANSSNLFPGITACTLSNNGKSVTNCTFNTSAPKGFENFIPYGITTNNDNAYVTYICGSKCEKLKGLGKFTINGNNLSNPTPSNSTSGLYIPSDLVYNSGNLYISNTTASFIAQYNAATLSQIPNTSVNTKYSANYEITINSDQSLAYVANGGSTSEPGYISKCTISNGLITSQTCAHLSDSGYGNILNEPQAVSVTQAIF